VSLLTATRDSALAAAAVAAAYCLVGVSTSFGATPQPTPRSVSVVASPSGAALYPGRSVRVRAILTNDTSRPLSVDRGTISGAVSQLPRGCPASWFRFAGPAGPRVVVAGNGGTATIRGRLTFVEAKADQSACAGATPALSLSVPS
jgi:hypothetical protein